MPDQTPGDRTLPDITVRDMAIADYDALMELMRVTPGVTVRDADSYEATARYLERNPGLSVVAQIDGQKDLVGCLMGGHDGRRGYLQHLVVLPSFRRQGIARRLIDTSLSRLAALGIRKCHLDVLRTNPDGAAFWRAQGWTLRTDIDRFSMTRDGSENA